MSDPIFRIVIAHADEFIDPEYQWIWWVRMTIGKKAWFLSCGFERVPDAKEAEEFWDLACDALKQKAV